MQSLLQYNYKLYRKITPSLEKVERLFGFYGKTGQDGLKGYVPDHIAFRTFKSCGGISIFQNWLQLEYDEMDSYTFPSKKLNAKWYQPKLQGQNRKDQDQNSGKLLPRIFLSEIEDDLLSIQSQKIINKYLVDARKNERKGSGRHFHPLTDVFFDHEQDQSFGTLLSVKDYTHLREESEYAAWTLIHGCKINHVAFSLDSIMRNILYNPCDPLNGCFSTSFSFEELMYFLEICDYRFRILKSGPSSKKEDNSSAVQISQDGKLLQGSILADPIPVTFRNGHIFEIGGGFVEFVERKEGREGFEAGNALNIFDSTNVIKTKK